MFRISLIVTISLYFVSCASNGETITYQQPASTGQDWYPLPADAPAEVVFEKPEIVRIEPTLPSIPDNNSGALSVIEQVDSLGYMSLKINRDPGVAWELVDTALREIDIEVSDRDRSEYKFELESTERTGWFSERPEVLTLVLIPQDFDTLVVVEGEEDTLPDTDKSAEILTPIFRYFQ